ncbi:MAG: electron transfer flavoprotein subunit beta/FixA family protein [Candidatus Nanopelagicaceae bacterium]
MEILACIKRVPITGSQLILTPDNMALQTDNMGYGISPHEENAVEAGVQLTEQIGGQLTLLTLGPTDAEEQLRASLAVGAARAILLETDGNDWDPQATANALVEAIKTEPTKFDMIIFGAESADSAGYQIHIRVAHALGMPIITNVKAMKVEGGKVRGERVVGTQREVYEAPLPAIVTVRDGLNVPRYPSVPGRMQARKKPVDIKSAGGAAPKLEKLKLTVVPSKATGAEILGNGPDAVPALVEKFKQIGVL